MKNITTTQLGEEITLKSDTLDRLVTAIVSMRDKAAEREVARVGDEIPDALLYNSLGWAQSIKNLLDNHPAMICFGERADSDVVATYNELLGVEKYQSIRVFVIISDTEVIEGARAEAETELEELIELGEMGDLGDDESNLVFNLDADDEYDTTAVEHYQTLLDIGNNLAQRMGLIHPLPQEIVDIFSSEIPLSTLSTPTASLINLHNAPLKATFIVDDHNIIQQVYTLFSPSHAPTPQQVLEGYIRIFPRS